MQTLEYTEEVNAKVDEWLTLASQSNILPNTEGYKNLLSLMADEKQIVIDTVVNTLNASEEPRQS
jgi:hypothetical protein